MPHQWRNQYRQILAESVSGQLHRDKECPISGVMNAGRAWRKVSVDSCTEIKSAPSAA